MKNAGVEVADYNAQTTAKATEQVTGATTKAYQTALNNQTGNLTTVLNDVTGPNDATGLATKETAKILVSTDSNQDGSVTATLYGKTYPDRNGDNKITYEDDILPVIKANLQSDLNPQNNQTDLKGSYGEIVALFNYMKQVADTAIPYQNADGTQGRIESANANSFSNVLNPNGSNMARNFGSDYATSLLTSIEDTKATLQAALKKIDDETGNTFDEAAFNKTFDDKLKAESIDIYTNQTNDMIQIAQNLLTAFKAASGDTIWKNSKAYTSPNTLVGTLTTAITAAQKNSTEGLAVLKNLAPSDNFLSTAYSKGDKDHGFTQTINSIWTDLYGTIDWFGTTISPLMKTDVTKAYLDDSNKPATAKDAAGNVIYSPDFIKAHDTVFNAATTLTNSVTKLMQQSAVISNDYGKVLNQLLTITDDYDYLTKSTLQPISNKGFSDQLTAPKPVQILAVQSTTPDSANQYQVQYVTTTGQSVGTGTFVGNPGDKVNAKVPDGYVLVPGEPGDQTVDNGKTVTFKVVPNSGTGEKNHT
ncbi:hypothetical protein [Secundilactobacillus silagei]|uniref:hypothetical protein n=1 Tax=Secundilactobacillus silagei TaxID=1293415 RepID=UPI0006D1AAB5|nr:hypothetical protein [Secundilactobacillus silagei]